MQYRHLVGVIGSTCLLAMMLGGETGCSKRQVTSGSGDQSMTEKQGSSETIRQEPIASIDSARSTESASRNAPLSPSSGFSYQPDSSLSSRSKGDGLAPSPDRSSSGLVDGNTADIAGVGDVYFDFDQYAVRTDAQPTLERNARWLKDNPGQSLLIEGHCDERGTQAYNLVLGEKRAKAAKRYLEDLGIPSSRLHTTTFGEMRPFCHDHNEGCWKYNRRAHFVSR